jgi:sec-independent protein translocase protein TatB
MSFQETAFIALLALLLFGPKKLPELARQLGKLMGEFRRASNEFRMQMEDELRIAEQADQQKKIAAMQAAAPATPALPETTAETTTAATGESSDEIMHENTIAPPYGESAESFGESFDDFQPLPAPTPEPLPIATSGDINLMPPATGLPEPRSAIAPVLDSIPHTTDPEESSDHPNEATYHG